MDFTLLKNNLTSANRSINLTAKTKKKLFEWEKCKKDTVVQTSEIQRWEKGKESIFELMWSDSKPSNKTTKDEADQQIDFCKQFESLFIKLKKKKLPRDLPFSGRYFSPMSIHNCFIFLLLSCLLKRNRSWIGFTFLFIFQFCFDLTISKFRWLVSTTFFFSN